MRLHILSPILLLLTLLLCTGASARAEEISFGYCDDDIVSSVGPSYSGYGRCAIYVPAEVAARYVGKPITSLRCGFYEAAADVEIYVAKGLDENYVTHTTIGDCKKGWQTLSFDTPYVIDGSAFYVGYCGTGTYFIGHGNEANDDATWFSFGHIDLRHFLGYPALSLRANIDLGDESITGVSILGMNPIEVKAGTPFNIYFTLKNEGSSPITSFTATAAINDQAPVEMTFTTNLAQGSTERITFPIAEGCQAVGLDLPLALSITEVNGTPLDAPTTFDATLNTYKYFTKRRLVVEEKTATWCGYCPRGILGAEYMEKHYPDDFILIAVHGKDVMQCPDYMDYINNASHGYPSARANRIYYNVTASALGFEAALKDVQKDRAVADISLTATYDDLADSTFQVEAKAVFPDGYTNKDYRIGFVLVENNILGNQSDFDNLMGMGSPTRIYHQHVARKVYEMDGYEGSTPASLEPEGEVTFARTLDWPKLPYTVKNREETYLIALLFDRANGEIKNAARTKIVKTGTPTALHDELTVAPTSAATVQLRAGAFVTDVPGATLRVYAPNGQQLNNAHLAPGIYLVHLTLPNGGTQIIKQLVTQ